MVNLWADRLAEIWAAPDHAGAGVVFGAETVLTARHVVNDIIAKKATRILARVVRPGRSMAAWAPMTVEWEEEAWDLALLVVDREAPGAEAWEAPSSSVPVVSRLGFGIERDCEAVGFPRSAVQLRPGENPADAVRQTEQAAGTVSPSGQGKNPMDPQRDLPRSWFPFDVDYSQAGAQKGWGGMSGAGVVLPDGRVIGIVSTAESDPHFRRLYAVRLADAIAQMPAFARKLAEATGELPAVQARAAPDYDRVCQKQCLGPDGVPMLIGEIENEDLHVFGVKPADLPGEPTYLAYIPRDADEELAEALKGAIRDRRMLLIVGGSAAGKSRSGAEAVRRLLPSHRLLPPLHSKLEDLSAISLADLGRAVIWLDDVQRYAGQVLGESLKRLLAAGLVVVGTIRQAELEHLDAPGDLRNPAGDALTDPVLVKPIGWRVAWESTERARVADFVHSPALLAAVASGMPLGAYCVGGRALVQRLERARTDEVHPCRYAFARTVLDWHGTFTPDPIRIDDAIELAAFRVDPEGRVDVGELDDALAWATTVEMKGPRQSRRQALLTVNADADSVIIHDYVLDHHQRRTHVSPVPDSVWRRAVERASGEGRLAVGAAAHVLGKPMVAISAIEPLARAGDSRAMSMLAIALHGGDAEASHAWLQDAVAQGRAAVMCGFADLLFDADPDAANGWYEQAALNGHGRAMFNLGVLSTERDPQAARRWYEQAAATGHTGAMNRLGALLAIDDPLAARTWYERAAEAGHSGAMNNLGVLLEEREPHTARGWYEQAAAAGNANAAHNLMRLLEDSEPSAARQWLEQAAACGDSGAMFELGTRLVDADPDAARQWYEQAAEAGHTRAMFHLTWQLADTDPEAARRWYERAAEAGHAPSMLNLAVLLGEREPVVARRWYERAASAGLTEAMYALGMVLVESEPETARDWFEKAAEAGDHDAMVNFGLLLEGSDRQAARRWYEQAARGGQRDAMFNLGVLLAESDPEVARGWYEQAAEAGDRRAMENLAFLLQQREPQTARRWLARAAAT